MRDLPHVELAIATCSEEHILCFVVVDHSYFILELSLDQKHAFASLLDVSDA